jgi:hypothetical protein
MRSVLVAAIVLTIAANNASAQRAPDMATLDRGDGISKLALDFGFSSLDTGFYDSALRIELNGQYVLHSGIGFYGAIPLARSFGDAPEPNPQPDFGIGNLELGGLLVLASSPKTSWVFRLGLALPTASDDRDGSATNFFATWPRLTDLALTVPNAYYLRFGVSPLVHVNNVFLRLDLGFDIGSDDNDAADELLRLNLGGGIDLGVVALSLELVNLYSFDGFGPDDDFTHTLAFTARFMGEQLQPFVSLGAPLDDNRDAINFFIAVGIQFAAKTH